MKKIMNLEWPPPQPKKKKWQMSNPILFRGVDYVCPSQYYLPHPPWFSVLPTVLCYCCWLYLRGFTTEKGGGVHNEQEVWIVFQKQQQKSNPLLMIIGELISPWCKCGHIYNLPLICHKCDKNYWGLPEIRKVKELLEIDLNLRIGYEEQVRVRE